MNIVAQVLLPLILAFIMLAMGLALVPQDFLRVARFPKAFLIGASLQIVSLPLVGFAVAYLWTQFGTLAPEFAVGLMIIAACPGGVTSNMLTHMAKGDTALSISLTAVISLLAVITVPIIVNMGLKEFQGAGATVDLPIFKTVFGVFAITTVPVLIGMLIRHFKQAFAIRVEPMARKVAAGLFVLIVLLAVAKDWHHLQESFASLGPATLSLNIATMAIAGLSAKLLGLCEKQGLAITLECGLQNGTLAIFIALTILGSELMMLPAAIYSLVMFVTAFVLLGGINWRRRQSLA